MGKLADLLRRVADRIDHAGAPKLTHWTFTFETRRGLVFREDGRGCRVAYLGDAEYAKAHDEADVSEHFGQAAAEFMDRNDEVLRRLAD